jgi:hypothetical protein
VALLLVGSLLSVALYPLAFLVLLARKVYALAKAALVSEMTGDPAELLHADAHLARAGTFAGGVGTGVGGILLSVDRAGAMLFAAALVFALAALVSRGLPRPRPALNTRAVPGIRDAIPPRIWSASLAAAALRAAGGALTYLLAFAIKRGGGDEWIFAAGLVAAGVGASASNLLATRIHRRLEPDWALVLGLLVPGLICAVGVVTIGNWGVLAIAFSIGLGRGVGTRAITVLNATVPQLGRARTIARSELLFQIASLTGAMLAVQYAPTPNVGFGVSSLVLVVAGATFGFHRRRKLRQDAARLLLGDDSPAVDRALPEALLKEAQRLALLGAYRMAVVIAAVAVDVLVERERHLTETPRYVRWATLAPDIAAVRLRDEQPAEKLVIEALAVAEGLVEAGGPPARERMATRPNLV